MSLHPYGPYENERQAYLDPPALDVNSAAYEASVKRHHLSTALAAVCTTLGVDLGAYDRRILHWLAGWEPSTVQVVIGLISRAYAAGQQAASTRTEK